MDLLTNALGVLVSPFNIMGDTVGKLVGTLDVADENFGGFFHNLTLLSMLLVSLRDKPFPKWKERFWPSYDYVIVGGGTAGAVMANRLSESPCVRVLLLEAGGSAPRLTEIPAFARLFYRSNIDWLYRTTPQKYGAFQQAGNSVPWNSGKCFGGSSVLNAMLYVRGNMKNYDDWAEEGCTGWGYDDVLKYFMKLEDHADDDGLDEGYHGKGGPMTIETPKYNPEIKQPLIDAAAALGYEVRDVNGHRQTGIFDLQATTRNHQRCSTAKAYLVPAEDRPNLTILRRAFVTKIRIVNRRAVGVEFEHNGRKNLFVRASREVIVSSGAVRAPQLLMLSGIGPKEHLAKFGIPVVADLPVGQNLQDHYASSLNFEVDPSIMQVVKKIFHPPNIIDYITKREGCLTAPNQVNLMAFLNGFNTTKDSSDFPRQELYFAEYSASDALLNNNLRPGVYTHVLGKYTLSTMYTCIVSLLQPYSRGEILLNSTNPFEQPLIDPHYYEDERDLWDVVEGMKICHAIGTSKEMQKVKSKPLDTHFPGCEDKTSNLTEYFACHARAMIITFWHPAGSCRMGQPDDARSVVDPSLKVIGVQGLRVVCAAVMPIVPSANTNVPTMMVAEKIADEMKNDVRCRRRL